MENAHDRAAKKKFTGVRLIQSGYHTRSLSLYAKLGYEVREPLVCMQGPAVNVGVPGCTVRKATESDIEGCNLVCKKVHGHDRGGELNDAVEKGMQPSWSEMVASLVTPRSSVFLDTQ